MRLHATIFALSQRIPTLGIDYTQPGPGKVAEMFEDRGQPGSFVSINALRAGYICEWLSGAMTPTPPRP
jgi:polysaccharide pyruvyl transferase WcaK-like protein